MTTQYTLNPVAIPANTLEVSSQQTIPSNITTASVQMTDSAGHTKPAQNSNWLKTAGTVLRWGVQLSSDGGLTWEWLIFQDNLPFGSVDGAGGMPQLSISSSDLVGQAGNLVRLGIETDTAITLGAVITTTP